MFSTSLQLELGEEADVVVDELSDVVELVAHDRQTIDAEAERETLPDLGIDSAVSQHGRMHHPTPTELEPIA